jgi:hypothetical protein
VVLCEVLFAKPPIIHTIETAMGLVRWAQESYRNGKVEEMVDPSIKGAIGIRCLKKFVEVVMNCLLDNRIERPSMDDVLWGLEFALQLQESADEDVGLNVAEEVLDDEKGLFPTSTLYDCDDVTPRLYLNKGKSENFQFLLCITIFSSISSEIINLVAE